MTHYDWDDAYNNVAHIPGAADYPARWAAQASAYRQSGVRVDQDIAYGPAPRQKLDLVWPDGPPKGLAVFVHGGYWIRLCKSDWTHLAEGARSLGYAVALPGYTRAPEARISQITQDIRTAIDCAAERVAGPIHLAGHSAGGHLVTRMICADVALASADRINHVLSISGLHDLRPLQHTQMNGTLKLDLTEARAESPALLEPRPGARVTAWVGGAERPEFLRQTQLLNLAWRGFSVETNATEDGHHHHFSVIEGLANPASPISKAFVDR